MSTHLCAPRRNEEYHFESIAERLAAIVALRAHGRLVSGWQTARHVHFELVDKLPSKHAGPALGAFRSHAESESGIILAEHSREAPGFFGRVFGHAHSPSKLLLTPEFLYATFDNDVHTRIAVDALRTVAWDGPDAIYIFGRGTPLLVEQAAASSVAALLNEQLRAAELTRAKQ